jgi:4-hydroxy-3-polyprenylbenzoate decarboxylase
MQNLRIIVAITGASGVIYGKHLLDFLNKRKFEIHLIISNAAKQVIKHELDISLKEITRLATYVYEVEDLSAPIVSGSFKINVMVIIPCSMKTLAGISHGYSDNLILRAADVTLKEKRQLILVPRETPLNVIHLTNMLELAKQDVVILPAMPGYYHKPKILPALIDYVVGKVLDLMEINHDLYERWENLQK